MKEGYNRFGREIIAGPPEQMLYRAHEKGEDLISTTLNKTLEMRFSYKIVLMTAVSAAVSDGWFVTQEEAKDAVNSKPAIVAKPDKPAKSVTVEKVSTVDKKQDVAATAPAKPFGGFRKVGTPRQEG